MRDRLRGLWLPLVTPFRDGALDEVSLRRLVRHYASGPDRRIDPGERPRAKASCSRLDELEHLVAAVRTELAAMPPHPADLPRPGRRATQRLQEMLDETAAWPIDGYLISAPYYLRPSQRGLLAHFSALADHASWPIVLYNIPYRSSVNLANETLLRLAQHPNIVGMKDCCADRAQSIDLLRRRPEGFRVLTGEDAQYFDALTDGADGAILLSAHVADRNFRAVQTPSEGRRPRRRTRRAGRTSPG